MGLFSNITEYIKTAWKIFVKNGETVRCSKYVERLAAESIKPSVFIS